MSMRKGARSKLKTWSRRSLPADLKVLEREATRVSKAVTSIRKAAESWIAKDDLPVPGVGALGDCTLAEALDRLTAHLLSARLKTFGGDGVAAGMSLGLSKSAFYRFVSRYHLEAYLGRTRAKRRARKVGRPAPTS
jgi:hypothetical protein